VSGQRCNLFPFAMKIRVIQVRVAVVADSSKARAPLVLMQSWVPS
jgi:hypothetical protein